MERRRLQIPSGMQDTLPGECAGKRRLEDKLRRLFTLGGYQEIETPILEYYDALDDQTFGYRPEQVWKTFDPQADRFEGRLVWFAYQQVDVRVRVNARCLTPVGKAVLSAAGAVDGLQLSSAASRTVSVDADTEVGHGPR